MTTRVVRPGRSLLEAIVTLALVASLATAAVGWWRDWYRVRVEPVPAAEASADQVDVTVSVYRERIRQDTTEWIDSARDWLAGRSESPTAVDVDKLAGAEPELDDERAR